MQNIIKAGAALALAGCLISGTIPGFASTNDKAELNASDVRGIQRKVAPNEVTLAGRVLFRVPSGAGGLSAAERADIIRQRLEDIADHYVVGSSSVSIAEIHPDVFEIAVGGQSLATIEPRMARAAGAEDSATLAAQWAERLRVALPLIRGERQVASRAR